MKQALLSHWNYCHSNSQRLQQQNFTFRVSKLLCIGWVLQFFLFGSPCPQFLLTTLYYLCSIWSILGIPAAEKSLELPDCPPIMLIKPFKHKIGSYKLGNAQQELTEGISGTVQYQDLLIFLFPPGNCLLEHRTDFSSFLKVMFSKALTGPDSTETSKKTCPIHLLRCEFDWKRVKMSHSGQQWQWERQRQINQRPILSPVKKVDFYKTDKFLGQKLFFTDCLTNSKWQQ